MRIIKEDKISVAILNNQKMIGGLLENKLSQFEHINSINVFSVVDDFFNHLKNYKIDVLVLDVFVSGINGIEILKKCRSQFCIHELKVVFLSSSIEFRMINEAMSLGISAFVGVDDEISEIETVFEYMKNQYSKPYLSKGVSDFLLSTRFDEINYVKLSPREDQLLQLICNSKTAKEIASELDLSVNTIHFYTKRLMVKMSVNRTPDLILKAINHGLIVNLKPSQKIQYSNAY